MDISSEEIKDLIDDISFPKWYRFISDAHIIYDVEWNGHSWSSSFMESKDFKLIINELMRIRLSEI
jgi:hypothetical protein